MIGMNIHLKSRMMIMSMKMINTDNTMNHKRSIRLEVLPQLPLFQQQHQRLVLPILLKQPMEQVENLNGSKAQMVIGGITIKPQMNGGTRTKMAK